MARDFNYKNSRLPGYKYQFMKETIVILLFAVFVISAFGITS